MNVENIQTPAYVFDVDRLIYQIRKIKGFFGKNVSICFAIKANPFVTGAIKDEADCFEVCSPGEFRICERAGIPPEKIVLSGVYKNEDDIKRIVKICKENAVYTVESPMQAELLDSVAKEDGLSLRVLLRLTSGNQFGMDEQTILKIIENRNKSALDIIGIQYYSGTQKREEKIIKEVEYLNDFIKKTEKNGFNFSRIEYGAGLKVGYFQNENIDEETELDILYRTLFLFGEKKITLEFGRFLVADCGSYYTEVVDIKNNDGVNYAIVNGGINHLNYYGQTMAMKLPFYKQFGSNGEESEWTVCGSLCTTADVLVKNLPLKTLRVGDVIRFDKVGAYSVTEGLYLFLSRDLPSVYLRQNGNLTLVRKSMQTDKINSI